MRRQSKIIAMAARAQMDCWPETSFNPKTDNSGGWRLSSKRCVILSSKSSLNPFCFWRICTRYKTFSAHPVMVVVLPFSLFSCFQALLLVSKVGVGTFPFPVRLEILYWDWYSFIHILHTMFNMLDSLPKPFHTFLGKDNHVSLLSFY